MNLQEANARLKKCQISQEELDDITPAYILLDLDKDDFCKIVDAVGVAKLSAKASLFERYQIAADALRARERYVAAKNRIEAIDDERQELAAYVADYRSKYAF